jgi:hypothetical protein
VAGETSFLNPQTDIGPDILTRIHHAAKPGGLAELQRLVLDGLNSEIRLIAQRKDIPPKDIAGMALAGNTTMTHLLLGLDPYRLCREPYIPAINAPPLFKASELGITIHPEAPVLIFPNVGSYFGGDLIAGILASGMAERERPVHPRGRGNQCGSCAGQQGLACGVRRRSRARPGGRRCKHGHDGRSRRHRQGAHRPGLAGGHDQDHRKQASKGDLRLRPHRSCGSTLPCRDDRCEGKVCGSNVAGRGSGMWTEFSISSWSRPKIPAGRDLTLAQTDIDALLRSKAAMYTILTTITNMVNVSMKDIGRFYIAGTFGSYIDPRSAIAIGMVPDLPLERYEPLGNTSLEGATEGLVSKRRSRGFVRYGTGLPMSN